MARPKFSRPRIGGHSFSGIRCCRNGRRRANDNMRISRILIAFGVLPAVFGQTDWPTYGHDPGGLGFSPLKQIDTKNVGKLQIAWTYDTRPAAVPASEGVEAKPAPRNRA